MSILPYYILNLWFAVFKCWSFWFLVSGFWFLVWGVGPVANLIFVSSQSGEGAPIARDVPDMDLGSLGFRELRIGVNTEVTPW